MAGSSKPQTMSTLTGTQQKVSKQIGSQILDGLATQPQTYNGQLTATLDPAFDLNYQQNLAGGGTDNSLDGATRDSILRLLSGESPYQLDPQTTANYFNEGVLNPMLRTYEKKIRPKIDQAFAASGRTLSGRRGVAQSNALTDIAVSAQQQLSTAQFNNQQLAAQLADNAAGRQVQGVQAANNFSLMPAMRATAVNQALAPYQAQRQAVVGADYQRFQMNQPYSNPWLQTGMAYLQNSELAAYNKQPNPLLGAGIGVVGGVAGAAATGGASTPLFDLLMGGIIGGTGSFNGRGGSR